MNQQIKIESDIDNEKYLDMIFSGFRKIESGEVQERRRANRETIRKIREKVNEAHIGKKNSVIIRPVPKFDGLTLTPQSWDECLNYYEIMMDRFSENKPYDIGRILELELWFYPLIEPKVGDVKRWYEREMTKVTKFHSAYLSQPLREIVAYLIYENLGEEGLRKHLDKLNSLL